MPLPAGPGFDFIGPDWLPTPDEIREEMHARESALEEVPDTDMEELVLRRYRSLAAELPPVLAERLESVAHDYLLYSVAAIMEDRLFPEQSAIAGSNAQRLDQRAGAELVRLRTQLGETADGDAADGWSGTVSLRGSRL